MVRTSYIQLLVMTCLIWITPQRSLSIESITRLSSPPFTHQGGLASFTAWPVAV